MQEQIYRDVEESFLLDALSKLRRRKTLVVIMAVFLFFTLGLGIQLLPRQYTSTAEVEVIAQTPHVVQSEAILRDLPFDDSTMGTEISLMESDLLFVDVIKKLNLLKNPEFNPNVKPSLLHNYWREFQILLAQYRPKEEGEVKIEPADKEMADTLATLRKHVKVWDVTRSRIIEVSATSHSNTMAQNIVNTMVNLYVANHLEYRSQISARAHLFVTQRLDELQQSAATASQAVETFRSSHGLMSGQNSSLVQEQATALGTHLLEAKARLADAESRYEAARHVNPDQLPLMLTSDAMARLRDQEAQIASKRSYMATTYGVNNPILAPITNQLRSIQGQIAAEAQRTFKSVEDEYKARKATVDTLATQLTTLEKTMADTDAARAHLATLQDESQTQRNVYTAFLQRSKETDDTLLFPATSVRVATPGLLPMEPSFPNNLIMLPGTLFLSLVTSIGVAMWQESKRKGIVSQNQIELMTRIPSLGMVPIRTRATYWHFDDAMEDLWNRLAIAEPKIILVTSPSPGEGKSFIARALVETASQRQINALLVDADMRSKMALPRDQNQMQTRYGIGLGDVLAGDAELTEVISSHTNGSLSTLGTAVPILPVGRVKGNPTRLLSLPRFEQVIHELKQQYSLIVIDSPPCLVSGDAARLAQVADTTVMVTRWNVTTPDAIMIGLRQLRLPDKNKIGILLNMVHPEQTARFDPHDALLFSNLYDRKS